MSESAVQQLLIRRARARNFDAWKTVSVGTKGFPDVVIAVPGRVAFIEVKKWNDPEPDAFQRGAHYALRRGKAWVEVFVGEKTLEATHAKVIELLDRISTL
jgi:hypothetical protein